MYKERERRKALLDDIAEIELLIRDWSSDDDPETQWAIFLLKRSLEKRRQALRELLH